MDTIHCNDKLLIAINRLIAFFAKIQNCHEEKIKNLLN